MRGGGDVAMKRTLSLIATLFCVAMLGACASSESDSTLDQSTSGFEGGAAYDAALENLAKAKALSTQVAEDDMAPYSYNDCWAKSFNIDAGGSQTRPYFNWSNGQHCAGTATRAGGMPQKTRGAQPVAPGSTPPARAQ